MSTHSICFCIFYQYPFLFVAIIITPNQCIKSKKLNFLVLNLKKKKEYHPTKSHFDAEDIFIPTSSEKKWGYGFYYFVHHAV